MEALDRARALNALLALPRLERMLRVYRTWVNVEGVEGGMALTRRELQCVLEFPELDHHVDFLFEKFRCQSLSIRNTTKPRVDLVMLLTTAAMLAQGPLADKARFVFSLVDLDTEDDIVEAELALVISTCCNGLFRLGLIEEGDNLSEMDAMAVAYEAFDFVELDDGDKITFAMFLKWCVFHPRPKALLGRASCLFSMCDAVREMKEALEQRTERLKNMETFLYYNDMHFGSLDERAESVKVVVGPIVGKVEATRINVLLEVDTPATVKCFAFPVAGGTEMAMNYCVPNQEWELKAFQPTLFTIAELSPGTAYVLRFLGIHKTDRDRCVAVVTTKFHNELVPASPDWRIRLLNHGSQGGKCRGILTSTETHVYQKILRDGYQSPKPTLTVHRGIFFAPQKVSAMLEIMEHGTKARCEQEAYERILDMIKQEYRCMFGEPRIWGLLRSHSNWILDDNESVLFSGFPEWRAGRHTEFTMGEKDLTRLALPIWQSYIRCLWGQVLNDIRCLEIDDGVVFAPIEGHINLQSEVEEKAFTRQITAILKKFPFSSVILIATSAPLFNQSRVTFDAPFTSVEGTCNDNLSQGDIGINDNSARRCRLIQELIEWNLSDQKRQVVFLSFDDVGSYQTLLDIRNTALSLTQLVCGPVVGIYPSNVVYSQRQENLLPQTSSTDQLVVRHGALDRRPQYAQILSLADLREERTPAAGGRRATGAAEVPYCQFQAHLVPLQELRHVHRILGPIVGSVSSHVAQVLIECDAEGDVACVTVDRLTLEEHRIIKRVDSYNPVIFTITDLTPGRTYTLSFQGLFNDQPGIFQTPHDLLPAFRILIMSEDSFLDGTTVTCVSCDGTTAEPPSSYIGNIVNHFFPSIGSVQANVTVHLGCIVALAHDLQRLHGLSTRDEVKLEDSKLQKFVRKRVRKCIRQHWNTPKTQPLLACGAHWFPTIGVLRALLIKEDIPLSFLRIVQTVLVEYEQVGDLRSHNVLPSEKYLFRLQNGVAVLMIDTLETILDNADLTPFVQPPETLLSTSQWAALAFWLQTDHLQDIQVNQTENPNTLVIMCDVPLISQRGENGEMSQMWNHGLTADDPGKSGVAATGTASWGMYPKEQARLLHLIFRKLQKDPKFHVVFICSGAYASRTTISDRSTKFSFQQIVVGPISRPKLSDENVNARPTFGDEELAIRYSIQQEIPVGATKSQQYCALELVPHPLGASSDVKFYMQYHDEARLILGPIIGRVTPRTARILIELDRPVPNLACTLVDPATSQSFSARAQVQAFTPTIVKVEGLQPGTRYAIKFEGLMENKDTVFGHVLTPAWISLTSEWLVVNCNSMANFLGIRNEKNLQSASIQQCSQWPRILANGMTSFTAQLAGNTSHRNGDTLGDQNEEHQNFNPWHSIEEEYLSEPLASPQLLLHLGGQVDLSRAFTKDELASLVVRLARQVESISHDEDSEEFQLLRSELRYRMQEVYRVAWGVPPLNRILGYSSNLMLLNEGSDLYFNQSNLRGVLSKSEHDNVSDATLTHVATILRGIAFELWQLYQNQLWVDLAERELKYGSKSSGNKTAFSTTFGINRVIVANASHEAFEYCNTVEVEAPKGPSTSATRILEPSTVPTVSLLSASSWKVVDEALETSNTTPEIGQARAALTKPKNPVQQLVLVISGDLMAWGGSKSYPALRSEIVILFEKLFAWKFVDRVHREIAVICCRTNGCSITFEVTDEKLSEKLTLTCVGSISEARELLHRDQKKVKGAAPGIAKSATISKGNFSKRFSYRNITNTASTAVAVSGSNVSIAGRDKQPEVDTSGASHTTRCRTFVSYRFVTDYRRGFFDETLRFFPARVSLPKAVLGPVIGRMVLREAPKGEPEEPLAEGDPGDPVTMNFTVPILLEINADARVVCVVTDILANQDIRVVQVLKRDHPHVFEIPSLVPERRYIYRFEGIANYESRRGSFHTPPSSSANLNFVVVSSNFPEQMDESTDSLWVAINKRVLVSWCGLNMILHLGGQVPIHEAAFECFEWISREFKLREKSGENDDEKASHIALLRRKVRQRLQQRYRLCWNVPNVRETLAHTSNWFLRSQIDIAPFFRNHEVLQTKAAQLVLSEAKRIVADYQLTLMLQDTNTADQVVSDLQSPTPGVSDTLSSEQSQHITPEDPESSEILSGSDKKIPGHSDEEQYLGNQSQNETELPADNVVKRTDSAQFIQTGEVGIFMCDMRSTPHDDVVTCNNRLLTPLTQQERAIIGEQQWQQLEKALKKKAIMVFVLCMELPLILTDAKHVDDMREELTLSGFDPSQEEAVGRWKLYDRQTLSQHWVWCRRQLEQLLNLLFRWKAKHRGRDVIVLSGGMHVGLETLLQDRETKLSVRNLTVGPLTARVEPDFENLPLDGNACPTFLGGERFTFAHTIVSSKNYLLAHAVITRKKTEQSEERGEAAGETKSASIETVFVGDDEVVDDVHPVNQYRRFPTWWAKYVPMGAIVFWDDTVMMRAQSDEDVTALARYLQDGREFTGALEVLFEKHQFAEAARMEELRSKHRRRQRGPEELRTSLRAVFAELWKVLPDPHRQQVAYFQDEFVFDFLLGYLAPTLFEDNSAEEDDVERPPLEFAAFSTLCRDFIFNACVLNLSLNMQLEDEQRAIALQRAEARRQAAEREVQRLQQEQQRAEEEAKLQRLQKEDPEAYAKRKLAEQEAAQQEKVAKAEAAREQRKAEKLRDIEEELAIAKEQRKLDKLAESGADTHEFTRRRELLALRVRKLEERKRHREAEEARRREIKERKKKEKAAQEKAG